MVSLASVAEKCLTTKPVHINLFFWQISILCTSRAVVQRGSNVSSRKMHCVQFSHLRSPVNPLRRREIKTRSPAHVLDTKLRSQPVFPPYS
jgi:hypothetical protein